MADLTVGYRLEPDGLEFLLPVTITQTLAIPVGGDPMHDGVPVPRLASRTATGEWEWLADQHYTADLDTLTFKVSGTTTHFSFLWEFLDWLFSWFLYLDDLEEMETQVGNSFTVSSGLFWYESRPDHPSLGDVTPFADDESVITPGRTQFMGSDPIFEQKYACKKHGSTRAGVDYHALIPNRTLDGLGLPEGRTGFTLTGTFNCV